MRNFTRMKTTTATGSNSMSTRRRRRLAPVPLTFLAALALALIVPARAQTFSDADWGSLGSGVNGVVEALTMSGTNLYVGGEFTTAGGVAVNEIAKWNGSAWSALGSGLAPGGTGTVVRALAVIGTNLYAGGAFSGSVGSVAKWNGSSWSALGSGMNGCLYALAVIGTDLYAGGTFTSAGGVPANYIAKWDGSAWSALGSGTGGNDPYVNALAVIGTDLYAGGSFSTAGGVTVNGIAKWDGNAWTALGSGMGAYSAYPSVYALAVSGTNLYAGGDFTNAGGVPANYIAKWHGTAWSALGLGVCPFSLAVSGTDLYAGGAFTTAGGVSANYIAKWDGSAWSALGSGVTGGAWVLALAADGAGHLFVGGGFTNAGGVPANNIAQAYIPFAPTILTSPQPQTAEAGAAAYLALEATGRPLPAYQWYFNDTNTLSCTNYHLVLTNIPYARSGTYTVVVTNVAGAVTSAPVTLNVIAPVTRRSVPGVNLTAQAGNFLGLDYRDNLGPATNWQTMATMTLSNASQFYFDVSQPLPPQRFYRAWQMGTPAVVPSLDMKLVPALTVTGNVGDSLRLDYINQFGPTDAWVTLATVKLTNTSQLYFDTSSIGQPPRLWRIVPVP